MSRINADVGRRVTPHPSQAGRMTTAMRAIGTAVGPPLLRIGLVVAGRILEERLVKRRTNVTVGPSERSTFVLRANLPPGFVLFERIGARYRLKVTATMTGRIAMGGQVIDLGSLREQAERAGGVCGVFLTEDARGKVTIGEATLLFQFVAPPPVPPRPQLPLSVKGGIVTQIDGRLAVIAAMSFLIHFGLVGAFYSDWMDSVVDDDVTARFIGTLVPVPVPAPVEMADTTTDTPSTDPAAPGNTTAAAQAPAKKRTAAPAAHDAHALGDLLKEAHKLEVGIIGALQPGPNIDRALAPESSPPVNLDDMANKPDSVSDRDGLLRDVGDHGPIQPGRGVGQLPFGDAPTASSTAGSPRRIALPPVVQELPFTASATVSNAEATIRTQIEPRARRCYQLGLQNDPTQSGRLVIAIRIGASGEVDSASATQNTGLSAAVAKCIVEAAERATFDRPEGGSGAILSVPFNFVKQG